MHKATKLAALALAAMMLATGLLVATPARSGDTSNTVIAPISGAPAGTTFYDVAWTPDGNYALFVGYFTGGATYSAYWYDATNGVWSSAIPAGARNIQIKSVCFDMNYGRFVMVANNSALSIGYWYYVTNYGQQLTEMNSGMLAYFEALDIQWSSIGNTVYSVGRKYSGSPIGPTCLRLTSGVNWAVYFNDASRSSGTYYAVEPDMSSTSVYVVGYFPGTSTGFYQYYNGAIITVSSSLQGYYSDITYDQYYDRMVLTVGSRATATAGVYIAAKNAGFYTTLTPLGTTHTTKWLRSVSINQNGVGVIVGTNVTNGYGVVYDLYRDQGGTTRLAMRSDNTAMWAAMNLKAVAIRPIGVPFAYIAGSAYKYAYTSAPSNVQVDTVYPHIAYVELYNAGTVTSKLNTQIDVDSGTGALEYDLVVRAWSNAGQANIQQVDAYMWYDGGANETFPSWGGSGYTSPGYENTRVMFRWLRAGNTFSILYPGTSETTLNVPGCSSVDEVDLKNVTVTFRFSPRQQFRFADGPFGPEGPGNRYSFLPEGQNMAALNNLDSWNIRMTVWDVGASQSNGYDEFGVFRYTYIGGAGLPGGGSLYGAGPPNTWVYLAPNNQDVTFSANCPYQLQVKSTDLVGAVVGNTIPASSLGIMGGPNLTAYTMLIGPGVPLYLVGSITPIWYYNPRNTGTTTTTSNADFNPVTLEPVMVRCWIHTVAEDRYLGVMTYSVVHP
jgi:hypothetical protein